VSPDLLEALCIFLEPSDHVVGIEVVGLKLLNDDEDEQVKHDEGAQNHIWEEEQGRPGRPTVLVRNAIVILGEHGVLHYVVPVLARADPD
jgi:hypothetical protein